MQWSGRTPIRAKPDSGTSEGSASGNLRSAKCRAIGEAACASATAHRISADAATYRNAEWEQRFTRHSEPCPALRVLTSK